MLPIILSPVHFINRLILLILTHILCLSSQKNEVRKFVYRKRRQLRLAFDLVCEKLDGQMVLKFERWKPLLQVLCPNHSPGKVSLLWHVLDRENKDYIGKYFSNYKVLSFNGYYIVGYSDLKLKHQNV